MTRYSFSRKRVLGIVGAVLLCLIILREVGIADLNLYRSTLSTQFSASKSMQNTGGKDAKQSWNITIRDGDGSIYDHTFLYTDSAPIIVIGEVHNTEFSGTYYVPLVKGFEMTCQVEYAGADAMDRTTVDGEMNIEIKADIRGLCSRSKAKALAIEHANECITQYFDQQFTG